MMNMAIGLYGSASAFPWISVFVVVGGAWSLGTIAVSLMQFGQSPQIRQKSNVLAWVTAVLSCFCSSFGPSPRSTTLRPTALTSLRLTSSPLNWCSTG